MSVEKVSFTLYKELDEFDKGRIMMRMMALLEDEKYQLKEDKVEEVRDNVIFANFGMKGAKA